MFSEEDFSLEPAAIQFGIYREAKEIIGNDIDCTDLLQVLDAFAKKASEVEAPVGFIQIKNV